MQLSDDEKKELIETYKDDAEILQGLIKQGVISSSDVETKATTDCIKVKKTKKLTSAISLIAMLNNLDVALPENSEDVISIYTALQDVGFVYVSKKGWLYKI